MVMPCESEAGQVKWGTPANKKSGCKAAFFVDVHTAR
jgi:hypothetical protein